MSTGQMQVRNAQNVRLLSSDFQLRYEPNFAWKSACSAFLALPALRAFWPMSSVDYTIASRARDVAGGGYHLTDTNTPLFNFDNLAPYVEFNGSTQYLSRADGGAGNWADITGTETYVNSAARGLTLGGWFKFDSISGFRSCITKFSDAGSAQRAYLLNVNGGFPRMYMSTGGGAVVGVQSTVTVNITDWWYIVGRFTPSTEIAIFVNDDEQINAVGIPASIFDSNRQLIIGAVEAALGVFSDYLDGRASLCFLCAAALSDGIVYSVFEQTRAMFGV